MSVIGKFIMNEIQGTTAKANVTINSAISCLLLYKKEIG